MNKAQLICQQLHFFLDQLEYENLLIFVELAITTLVEYFQELVGAWQSKKIVNLKKSVNSYTTYLLFARFENQPDIGFV